ncbi:hypothetical protein BEN35_09935 [Streptomyces fradiae]|nr:hypothetical protein BEN35_09935 [Streptomyces fradiae]
MLRLRRPPAAQTSTGARHRARASRAQAVMAACRWPRKRAATTEPPKTAAQKRWIRKVASRSGLAESPLGVTTKELLRRSTASTSDLA